MRERLRNLFGVKALPVWMFLAWRAFGILSRIEYIGRKVTALLNFRRDAAGQFRFHCALRGLANPPSRPTEFEH
jgi:hypothetical protein